MSATRGQMERRSKNRAFEEICKIVYLASGILLDESKRTMVSTRLAKRFRTLGVTSEEQYLEYFKEHRETELDQLINVISTNVTSFFRESQHFTVLSNKLDEWISSGQKRLRIWCAAAATGEEPYTLAMVVAEAMRRHKVKLDAKILCTDICTDALRHAAGAQYSARRVEGISPERLKNFWEKQGTGDAAVYTASQELRDLVVLKRLNLIDVPYAMKGPFDAVFCRNVMIYFDDETRLKIVTQIERLLRVGGAVAVGMSETIAPRSGEFERLAPSMVGRIG